MAREETDREDLLKEATALTRRVELLLDEHEEPIVVGFRRDGSASYFFGVEPVYQFNTRNELRRGFEGGRIIKAEKGKLVSLRRVRQRGQVQLVRHEFDHDEQVQYLDRMIDRLLWLLCGLREGRYQVRGQVPQDADIVSEICTWVDCKRLDCTRLGITIAGRPHAGC